MDFKFKGIGWVGGIYQKFETLCHEVDNIVNQDTVKYVENQAQSVGKSMKRLYSGVIHDILPPLKHEGQEVTLKRSDIVDAYVESEASIQEDHMDTMGDRSNVEPNAVDPIGKQLDHASSEVPLPDPLSTPASAHALEGAEFHRMSGQVSEVWRNTSSDVKIDERAMLESSASGLQELIAPCEEECSGVLLGNEFVDCNKNVSCQVVGEVPLSMSVHNVEFHSTQKEGTIDSGIAVDVVKEQLDCAFGELCLVEQLGNPNSEDSPLGTEYLTSELVADVLEDAKPEVSIEENATMQEPLASEVSELISHVEEEPFEDSLLSEFNASSTLDHGDQSMRTVKNDFADDSECVSVAQGGITSSKVIYCEESMAEVAVASSSGSILKESLSENSPEHAPAKSLIYHHSVDGAGYVSPKVHSSSIAAVSVFSNDLSMDSLENDASRTVNGTETLTGILGNKNVYMDGESAQLQALCSSDIGTIDDFTDDVSISSMDTIALCDEVKLEDSCVIVDSNALCAVSRIMRKHRSYKKMIQDALNSKARLAKEYEQLAIWFGDADMGSNQDYLQTIRPSSSSSTILECKISQTELICDSDWELL